MIQRIGSLQRWRSFNVCLVVVSKEENEMKKIYRQHLAPIFILCVAAILASCSSTPLLASPTPAPECIGDTWSYDKTVQTKINNDPDLTIEINRMGSWGFCPRTLTIHGDGGVEIFLEETGGREAS